MSELSRSLRSLFGAVLKEVEENPSFAERLAAALPPARSRPRSTRQATVTRAHHRRQPGVLDPFAVYIEGEVALRSSLQRLDAERLKDIIAEHGMDASKLALKWKSTDRLVSLIVDAVRQRSEKGEAFRRTGKGSGA